MRIQTLGPSLLIVLACAVPAAGEEKEAPRREGLVYVETTEAGVESWLRPIDGATVLRVRRGPYRQRPYEGGGTTREPRPVEVESFFLDRTEVTNAQFARFLEAMGTRLKGEAYEKQLARWLGPEHADLVRRGDASPSWSAAAGREQHPVVNATGFGALDYAKWAGGRIPTQVEWEKAAGGPEGNVYPWGAGPPDASRANFARPKLGGTRPVGSCPDGAGPYGHLDMAGNAYDRVLMRTREGEVLPVMIKGGSWLSPHPLNLRVLDMCVQPMHVADRSVGFRVAMDDPEPARENRGRGEAPVLRIATDFSDAVEEAEERRVPIFLSLQYDTCGQCDRVRAQLFRDPRFIAYCNEHLVVLVGHQPGDAGRDGHAKGEEGACPLYPGVKCFEHYRVFQYGLQVVGEFTVSPGNFVLHPDLVWQARKGALKPGQENALFLVPERELPKWGGGVEAYLAAFEKARKQIARGDTAKKGK